MKAGEAAAAKEPDKPVHGKQDQQDPAVVQVESQPDIARRSQREFQAAVRKECSRYGQKVQQRIGDQPEFPQGPGLFLRPLPFPQAEIGKNGAQQVQAEIDQQHNGDFHSDGSPLLS